jgi:hypothetical protein
MKAFLCGRGNRWVKYFTPCIIKQSQIQSAFNAIAWVWERKLGSSASESLENYYMEDEHMHITNFFELQISCKIWGFHGGDYEE